MEKKICCTFLLIVLVIFAAFVVLCCSQIHNDDVRGLVAFKQSIFEDPYSRLSDWNPVNSNPCSWNSVICSFENNQHLVVSINLSGSALKGFLAPEIGLLTSLQQLYLNDNMFQGTLPKEIGNLKNLTVLDLSDNRFAGPIPTEIGKLDIIKKLDLHSNGLTGVVPPELGKLKNLEELRLDRNRLEGKLISSMNSGFRYGKSESGDGTVGLCQSPQLKVGDFSYNFFVGDIPRCLKYLPRSSFKGNCFRDKYEVPQRTSQLCTPVQNQLGSKNGHKQPNENRKYQNILQQPNWLLILEIATLILAIVCLFTCISVAVNNCKLKQTKRISLKRFVTRYRQNEISSDSEVLKNVRRFSRQELEVACEDFCNIILSSSESESVVYKGTVKDVVEITVISLCSLREHWTRYHEFSFQAKVEDLSRLEHENVVKLLGYCNENEPFSRMLVLDYASNGTLYDHLHYGEGPELSWRRRMKIILGITRGLKYLHIDLKPPFALCQLNSNSVYLTEDFSPKIVYFESFKRIIHKPGKHGNYMKNRSSLHGYMDDNEQKEMDIQHNIFLFGVLLLEIISGRIPYCKNRGSLIDWAMQYLQDTEKVGKLVDPVLKNVKVEELALICSVAYLCIQPDPSKRPSMQIISAVLEKGIDLSMPPCLHGNSSFTSPQLDLLS